jgi:hypothetical protein
MSAPALPLRRLLTLAAALLSGLAIAVSPARADRVAPPPSLRGLFFPPLVAAGPVPAPDDTIVVDDALPYLGQAATGRGYVLLAPGHAALTRPVLVVEGFDIDNSMGWDELYTLLNQEALVESLLARGNDAVVLDFTDATDYIQRNAFVFNALLARVESAIDPGQSVPVVGASMGGLVARYGLAWLESNAVPHRVPTFISFDGPQRGANIPLGLQHWVDFFSGQSADAAFFRDRLNTPAARQMLVYHFASTSGQAAAPDPLRAGLAADLAAVGGYPALPRRVAFSDGAGDGTGQGFLPGAQLIQYDFSDTFGTVLINGNVWAVPDGPATRIFQGRIRIFYISDTRRDVTVAGTKPYDSAPGGWRGSMAQLDTTQAPYGDIVALHDNHCFIPTVSALDVDDSDLMRDLTLSPDLAAESPFDAVYYADSNEEHVFISPLSAQRLLAELEPTVVAAGPLDPAAGAALAPRIERVTPNPFRGRARLALVLPRGGRAELAVYALDGRRVAVLASGSMAAGPHEVAWDGRDDAGRAAPAGLYFARLAVDGRVATGRLVRL